MDIKLLKNHKHWNAKPTKLDGKDATEFHSKWVNYLNANDNWQEINTDFVETVDKFEMKNAPFEMYVPLYSDGVATQHINNRWGVGIKQKIKDVPINITIKAIGVSKVKGIIEIGDLGWGETNYVIYKNAWSNADLIYYIQHGKAPRLRKLVRFNSNPNLTADAKFSFELGYNDNTESFIWDWEQLPTDSQKHQYRKLDRNETKQITDRGLSFKLKGSNRRGATFKSLRIWDSTREIVKPTDELWNGNIWQRIDSEVKHIGDGKVILTKIVPKTFFDKEIIYPVFTDTTTTFFPNQDTEGTSADGWTRQETPGATWATLVAAAGNQANDTSTSLFIQGASSHISANWNSITRGMAGFDTSSIDSGDTVSSAILSLKGKSKTDGVGYTPATNVYSASFAIPTAVAAEDYNSIGPTKFSTDITYASFDNAGWNPFTFNQGGRDSINKTGTSEFGFAFPGDIEDDEPAISSKNDDTLLMAHSAETEGTESDPKLVVEHSTPSGPATLKTWNTIIKE